DSSVEQTNPTEPTTMSFEFAEQESGSWIRRGDRPLRVPKGSLIQLGIFDTSQAGNATLEQVVISFEPEPGSPPSPFGPDKSVTYTNLLPSEGAVSTALDLIAPVGWTIDAAEVINTGAFHGTFEVYMVLESGGKTT